MKNIQSAIAENLSSRIEELLKEQLGVERAKECLPAVRCTVAANEKNVTVVKVRFSNGYFLDVQYSPRSELSLLDQTGRQIVRDELEELLNDITIQ